MLSRSDFETLFNTNREQLNAEYARATPEEQTQMRAWLDEISPPPELLDGIPSLERILEAQENELKAEQAAIAQARYVPPELSPAERQRQANILRAKRANLKRRLTAKIRPYLPFTAKQAAEAIKANEVMLENYLRAESAVPGREIVMVEPGKYMLIDLFA